MHRQFKRWDSFVRRGLSFILSLFFTLLQLNLNTFAYAFQAVDSTPILPLLNPLELSANLSIPKSIGSIQEVYVPSNAASEQTAEHFIFYLQNAHTNYDAETNIKNLIEFLQKEYHVPMVMAEGGRGRFDSLFFRAFPDRELKEQILNDYVKRGELSGAEIASILNDQFDADYYGIETQALYDENKKAFLESLETQQEVSLLLGRVKTELERQAKRSFSPESQRFYDVQRDFKNEVIDVLKYIQLLRETYEGARERSRDSGLPMFDQSYSELKKLLDSEENEKKFKGEKYDIAVNQLIEDFDMKVLLKLPYDLQLEMGQMIQMYRTGKINHGMIAGRIEEVGRSVRIPIEIPEILTPSAAHARTLSSIKGTTLFLELSKLEAVLRDILPENETEGRLLLDLYHCDLLKDLSKLELVHQDWNLIKDQEPFHLISAYPDGDTLKKLSRLLLSHYRFYTLAEARDEALFTNILSLIGQTDAKVSIVVTGGFHSEGITEKLKAAQVPYALITPHIGELGNQDIYVQAMKGQMSFMKYFNGSLWDALAKDYAARMAASLKTSELTPNLKRWRDRIIQDTIAEGRVTRASSYTKYVDALVQALRKEFEKSQPFQNVDFDAVDVRTELEREVNLMMNDYFLELEKLVQAKLSVLADGMKQIVSTGNFSIDSVGRLVEQVARTSTSNLAVALALVNPDDPVYQAEAVSAVGALPKSDQGSVLSAGMEAAAVLQGKPLSTEQIAVADALVAEVEANHFSMDAIGAMQAQITVLGSQTDALEDYFRTRGITDPAVKLSILNRVENTIATRLGPQGILSGISRNELRELVDRDRAAYEARSHIGRMSGSRDFAAPVEGILSSLPADQAVALREDVRIQAEVRNYVVENGRPELRTGAAHLDRILRNATVSILTKPTVAYAQAEVDMGVRQVRRTFVDWKLESRVNRRRLTLPMEASLMKIRASKVPQVYDLVDRNMPHDWASRAQEPDRAIEHLYRWRPGVLIWLDVLDLSEQLRQNTSTLSRWRAGAENTPTSALAVNIDPASFMDVVDMKDSVKRDAGIFMLFQLNQEEAKEVRGILDQEPEAFLQMIRMSDDNLFQLINLGYMQPAIERAQQQGRIDLGLIYPNLFLGSTDRQDLVQKIQKRMFGDWEVFGVESLKRLKAEYPDAFIEGRTRKGRAFALAEKVLNLAREYEGGRAGAPSEIPSIDVLMQEVFGASGILPFLELDMKQSEAVGAIQRVLLGARAEMRAAVAGEAEKIAAPMQVLLSAPEFPVEGLITNRIDRMGLYEWVEVNRNLIAAQDFQERIRVQVLQQLQQIRASFKTSEVINDLQSLIEEREVSPDSVKAVIDQHLGLSRLFLSLVPDSVYENYLKTIQRILQTPGLEAGATEAKLTDATVEFAQNLVNHIRDIHEQRVVQYHIPKELLEGVTDREVLYARFNEFMETARNLSIINPNLRFEIILPKSQNVIQIKRGLQSVADRTKPRNDRITRRYHVQVDPAFRTQSPAVMITDLSDGVGEPERILNNGEYATGERIHYLETQDAVSSSATLLAAIPLLFDDVRDIHGFTVNPTNPLEVRAEGPESFNALLNVTLRLIIQQTAQEILAQAA